MTFPVLGGNGAVAGYQIDNSLRFNRSDSPYLSRTPSSSGNQKTFTTSFWLKKSNVTQDQPIITCGTSTVFNISIVDSGTRFFISNTQIGVTQNFSVTPNALSRDPSAWLHVVITIDTTESTSSDRVKIYFNGELQSHASTNYPSLNFNAITNPTTEWRIGYSTGGGSNYLDGYLSEFVFIDGTALTPTSFGETDESSGIWKPIDVSGLTFGTNGFYLDFENNGSLGADQSGNGNNFTPNNLTSTDQTTDTPTNNFATLNALNNSGGTLSEGNTTLVTTTSANDPCGSTQELSSGKWYMEFKITSGANLSMTGVSQNTAENVRNNKFAGASSLSSVQGYSYYGGNGQVYYTTSQTSYGSSLSDNDIVGMAIDLDNNKIYWSINGTFQNSADPSAGTGGISMVAGNYGICVSDGSTGGGSTFLCNFGNPSFSISSGNSDGKGYGNFEYAPPSGYLALCTQNLATELSPTIDDGSQYFSSTLYTGDGTTSNAITGVGFQGDFAWFKARSSAYSHMLFDSTRGGDARLNSDATYAESTGSDRIQSFDSDGYTISTNTAMNNSGTSFVVWSWLANGGTTSSNTDGSITSTVQANTTAGFSIVTWTGTGSNATVGHGLGVVPKMIINKNRSLGTGDWVTYHNSIGATKFLQLNSTSATGTSIIAFNNTEPTSSVFSVGTWDSANGSGNNMVSYAFAEIEGYSKFGSYTGNGSTDGTFVYTGFRPSWVMIKRTDSAGNDWIVIDTKRFTYNQISSYIRANTSDAETDQYNIDEDIVSNGFKIRGDSGNINASGSSYIYMAFAESPFCTSTGVPVVAR